MESPPEGRDSGSGQQMSAVDFARAAAQLACDSHCEDVRLLDLRGLSQICDLIVVASGTSDRQMRSVAAEIEALGQTAGYQRFRVTGDSLDTWIVVDFIDLIVHLFEPGRRQYYDLENLWADAPEIDFQRPSATG
ncbi:MAG: ribosome silencing factor [Phycisphaerae bacterium]|nr:ribosome silencing factor [Phycisphaerae bacterium]|tara:strand:+ start:178 stop:582 length:405 start_codon:yes stop_codon:yes gene_type:complete